MNSPAAGRFCRSDLRWDLDRWLLGEYRQSAVGLSLFRVLYAATTLLVFFPNFRWVAELPDSFLNPPPGPFAMLRSVPDAPLMVAIELSLCIALVSLLLGYRSGVSSWAVTIFAVAGHGIAYSFGKIDHNIVLWIVPAVLAGSGWDRHLSLDRHEARTRGPYSSWRPAVLAVIIGVAYFTAGYAKAVSGWLDPTSSASWGYVVRNTLLHGRDAVLVDVVPLKDPGIVWEAFDIGTVVLEAGVLLAVVRRRLFGLALVGLTFLHLSILLLMDISFHTVTLAYAVFLPWGGLSERVPDLTSRFGWRPPADVGWWRALLVAGCGTGLYVITRVVGGPLVGAGVNALFDGAVRYLVLAAASAIAAYVLLLGAKEAWRNPSWIVNTKQA